MLPLGYLGHDCKSNYIIKCRGFIGTEIDIVTLIPCDSDIVAQFGIFFMTVLFILTSIFTGFGTRSPLGDPSLLRRLFEQNWSP